jgi:hypothetical protein
VVTTKEIDLFAICSGIGLTVEYAPLAVNALLEETELGFVATVDSTAKLSRQRMSLAHEIGHLLLYRNTGLRQAFGHVASEKRQTNEAMEIEELCDHFATELLMPSAIWDSLVLREGLSLTTLMKLKNVFGVSIATAARRLVQLATIDCGIIVWRPIYDGIDLIKVQPIRLWNNLWPGQVHASEQIEMKEQPVAPGSPYYAFEKKGRSAGKILLSFRGVTGNYLAQSDMLDATHAITLMLPERLGWHRMFRRIDSAEISDLQ